MQTSESLWEGKSLLFPSPSFSIAIVERCIGALSVVRGCQIRGSVKRGGHSQQNGVILLVGYLQDSCHTK